MPEIKNWLNTTKKEKPELSDFITSIESYFSETGFNAVDFDKLVDTSLKTIEQQSKKLLDDKKNATD